MGVFNGFFKFMDKEKEKQQEALSRVINQSVNATMRGSKRQKQTINRWESQFSWYEGVIPRNEFRQKEVIENLKIIRDLNPDSSMAVWNFLRLANSGFEVEALTAAGGKPEKAATQYLQDLSADVGKLYGGGTDKLINVLLLCAVTQGAVALEVELNESLTEIVDFHAVDPSLLDFRPNKETGEIELVQYQEGGTYTVLNREQVFYDPIDPEVDDPYGRPPLLPILQVVFFQVEVLKDLQKVIHHQGYERFDIKVVEEAIMNNMPEHIRNAPPDEVSRYVSSYVADIQAQMAEMEPDDDFYHTDSVEVSTVGGVSSSSMDATKVIDVINQQIVTALKQLPILLGRNEGSTETHGTIQWKIYVSGIENIQRSIKRLLERAYNVALQIKGKQRRARVTFNQIETSDRLKDAQSSQIETDTKIKQVQQGWIDNDEAAQEMVGHNAVNEPQPVQTSSNTAASTIASLRTNRRQVKSEFNREEDGEDEYVGSIDEDWSSDIAKLAKRAKNRMQRFLNDQRDTYISRLENAEDIPTRVLTSAWSIRSIYQSEGNRKPSHDFEQWIRINILYDYEYQMSLWEDELLKFIDEGVEIAGTATFLELDLDFAFNTDDEELLRAMTERSKRSAELIQGVTDEDVLLTLWDVLYEGQYSVDKAREALQESYPFSNHRAEKIAHTEILGAGRTGQYFADKQSGIVIGKKWRSALQERTREGHREADNQVVALDEPFYVANADGQVERLLYPGDTSLGATASNVINCRCWYKRILEGQEMK